RNAGANSPTPRCAPRNRNRAQRFPFCARARPTRQTRWRWESEFDESSSQTSNLHGWVKPRHGELLLSQIPLPPRPPARQHRGDLAFRFEKTSRVGGLDVENDLRAAAGRCPPHAL